LALSDTLQPHAPHIDVTFIGVELNALAVKYNAHRGEGMKSLQFSARTCLILPGDLYEQKNNCVYVAWCNCIKIRRKSETHRELVAQKIVKGTGTFEAAGCSSNRRCGMPKLV